LRKIDNFWPSGLGRDIVFQKDGEARLVFTQGRRATRAFGVKDREWLANGAASL
jgi:hypothetical protein